MVGLVDNAYKTNTLQSTLPDFYLIFPNLPTANRQLLKAKDKDNNHQRLSENRC